MSKVYIPVIKAIVDPYLGNQCSQDIGPWDVINTCGSNPYAVKAVLGWVVNGPLNGNSGASETELPLAMVNCQKQNRKKNSNVGRKKKKVI